MVFPNLLALFSKRIKFETPQENRPCVRCDKNPAKEHNWARHRHRPQTASPWASCPSHLAEVVYRNWLQSGSTSCEPRALNTLRCFSNSVPLFFFIIFFAQSSFLSKYKDWFCLVYLTNLTRFFSRASAASRPALSGSLKTNHLLLLFHKCFAFLLHLSHFESLPPAPVYSCFSK